MSNPKGKERSGYKFDLPGQGPNFVEMPLPDIKVNDSDEYEDDIEINEITLSPHQTRKIKEYLTMDKVELEKNITMDIVELANNIKENGLINRIVVRPNKNPEPGKRWLLIAGERRLTAFKYLELKTIPAKIKNKLKDDEVKAWALTISENVERKNLNPDEASNAIEIAKNEFNMDNHEIAKAMGVSEKRVYQLYGITKMPQDLISTLKENDKLTKRHLDAFKFLIKNNKINSIVIGKDDPDFIQEIKYNINELLGEIISDDLSGQAAFNRAKELVKPTRKCFLFDHSRRLLFDLAKRRPVKQSNKKSLASIERAEIMIQALQSYIQDVRLKIKQQ